MQFFNTIRRPLIGAALLAFASQVQADALDDLKDIVTRTEAEIGGRVGVTISGGNLVWGYRADERFPMNSTFKSVLCGAVLAQADKGALTLDETIRIAADNILDFAPATKDLVGEDMQIDALCYGTLDKSDNTAANLLIGRLGGPGAVTSFLRAIGDPISRLDRLEPQMNLYMPGNPRDTTTPAAMVATWETLLIGDALSSASQDQLADWMGDGWATGAMIRPHLPSGWGIADKSGGGRSGSRSIVAMITPPDQDPVFTAIYIAESPARWDKRTQAISDIGAAIIQHLQE